MGPGNDPLPTERHNRSLKTGVIPPKGPPDKSLPSALSTSTKEKLFPQERESLPARLRRELSPSHPIHAVLPR